MHKWIKLLIGCGLILLFMKVVPEVFKSFGASQKFLKTVHGKDIDVSALFYSEEEKTLEAAHEIAEKLNKTPAP